MYKYRKAIFVLFFCLLGDIAYSAEKYSKKSQKNFNTFLKLSQSSEYKKLLKKNSFPIFIHLFIYQTLKCFL